MYLYIISAVKIINLWREKTFQVIDSNLWCRCAHINSILPLQVCCQGQQLTDHVLLRVGGATGP